MMDMFCRILGDSKMHKDVADRVERLGVIAGPVVDPKL